MKGVLLGVYGLAGAICSARRLGLDRPHRLGFTVLGGQTDYNLEADHRRW